MLLYIKQWESKYIRDFSVVKNGDITEESLYNKIAAMYYDYVSNNNIEPFILTYGRGNGFCINANSHIGVIVYDDIVLFITSMIPDLSLGKILYLQAQAEDVENDSTTKQVLSDNLNDEESIAAVDYFVVSLVNIFEDIKVNGLLSQLLPTSDEANRIVGRLDISGQVTKHPAYDKYCVEKTVPTINIDVNKVIKAAIIKAKEVTTLEWIIPILSDAEQFLQEVDLTENIEAGDFPKVNDYTSIKREDYEKALRFSKYILFGYDPLEGEKSEYFPEFMLDMNEVFEFYVTVGLKRIFKIGFENKKEFTLGVGPTDIPIDRKCIELDGYYEHDGNRVVLDTKNKYRTVLDREIPDFVAANPDIYQQYYYASRVDASNIILVYPSSKKRTAPIGEYFLNFRRSKRVNLYFWALYITGTPRENKKALINLAQFIDSLKDSSSTETSSSFSYSIEPEKPLMVAEPTIEYGSKNKK